MSEGNWMFFQKAPDSTILLNLDCAQSVEILSDSSLKVRFGENQTITIEGQPALNLVNHLMTKVIRFMDDPKS